MPKSKIHSGPHKYRRVRWGKNQILIWRCMLPDCNHYLHREFILGKQTLCWRCGRVMIMTRGQLEKVKPTCGCSSTRDRILKLLEESIE